MRSIDWYFDFVSPFAYLAMHRLKELPRDVSLSPRPVLFAGLLNHFGQKGPAEVPSKRQWTYRWCTWSAARSGVPLRFPSVHPFYPLHHLRLAIAAGNDLASIGRIFEAIWTTGADPVDSHRFSRLCSELSTDPTLLGAQQVKDQLRLNTEAAAAAGVFGVPTLVIDGERFWGVDGMDFALAFLADPAVVRNDEIARIDRLPVGAARKA